LLLLSHKSALAAISPRVATSLGTCCCYCLLLLLLLLLFVVVTVDVADSSSCRNGLAPPSSSPPSSLRAQGLRVPPPPPPPPPVDINSARRTFCFCFLYFFAHQNHVKPSFNQRIETTFRLYLKKIHILQLQHSIRIKQTRCNSYRSRLVDSFALSPKNAKRLKI